MEHKKNEKYCCNLVISCSKGLYGFVFLNIIPDASEVNITDSDHFAIDYTFFLNLAFLVVSGILIYLGFFKGKDVKHHKEMAPKSPMLEKVLKWLAIVCYAWLAVGLILKFMVV